MVYEHSLDVGENENTILVHLYIHTKILEIRFLPRNLPFYMKIF